MNVLGNAWAIIGNHSQAIVCYKRAIELDPNDASAWNNLGNTWGNKGEYDQAIVCYKRAIELDPNDASAWNNLGNTWFYKENYDESIVCCNRAIELHPKSESAWNNLGGAWFQKGNYDQAIVCYKRVIELHPQGASAWNNLGCTWFHKDNYDESIVCCNRAIEFDPNHLNAWINLGNAWDKQGRHQKANKCYDRAISIDKYCLVAWQGRATSLRAMEVPFDPYTRLGIGGCYEHQGDLNRAERIYRELKEITQSNPNYREYYLRTSLGLGRVHNKQEEYHNARKILDELLWDLTHRLETHLNEAAEQHKYLDIFFELYRQFSIACHGEGDLSLSFNYLERSKNVTLLSALQAKQKVKNKNKIPRYATLEQKLVRYLPDEKTALVEFFISEQKSYAFVLRKQIERKPRLLLFDKVEETYTIDDKVIPLDIDSATLEAVTSIWHRAYQQFKGIVSDKKNSPAAITVAKLSWFSTMNRTLSYLYDRIFPRPLRDQLAGITKLIFVPTGPLYDIPLHALCWEEAGEARYMIDEFIVSYLPSASVLPYISKDATEIRSWDNIKVFVGDTSGLDNVYRQVEAWRDKFENHINQKIKYDCDQAEHLLSELTDSQVVIYCGHAGCDRNVDPLVSSYLMLKRGNLYMKEIMDKVSLSSPLDLVVLSGCETAMTANDRHDDYVGLPAAFYCAGASNVIGSLWSVEDGATYVLMDKLSDIFAEITPWYIRFIPKNIKHLVFKKESKADALRNASLLLRHGLLDDGDHHTYPDTIQSIRVASGPKGLPVTVSGSLATQLGNGEINFDEWKHPYYWASFCCYGLG